MRYCPACGTNAIPDAAFCVSCGTRLPYQERHDQAPEHQITVTELSPVPVEDCADQLTILPLPESTIPVSRRPGYRAAGFYLLIFGSLAVVSQFISGLRLGRGAEAIGGCIGILILTVLPFWSGLYLLGTKNLERGRKIGLMFAFLAVALGSFGVIAALTTSKTGMPTTISVLFQVGTCVLLVFPGPLFLFLLGNKPGKPVLPVWRVRLGVLGPFIWMLSAVLLGVLNYKYEAYKLEQTLASTRLGFQFDPMHGVLQDTEWQNPFGQMMPVKRRVVDDAYYLTPAHTGRTDIGDFGSGWFKIMRDATGNPIRRSDGRFDLVPVEDSRPVPPYDPCIFYGVPTYRRTQDKAVFLSPRFAPIPSTGFYRLNAHGGWELVGKH